MLESISFAAATVAPIFLLIFIGVILRRTAVIGKEFISTSSKVVFKFALPAMIFNKMSKIEGIPDGLAGVLLLFVSITLIFYGLLWLFACKLPVAVHGSFVQGAFRGNIAIIGLAVIENAFGQQALQVGVVVLMVMMPLYNLLAIIVLGRSSSVSGSNPLGQVALNLVKNPLIWAVVVGLPFGLYDVPIPSVIVRTLEYLSRLTMPLALMSIGGSLTLSGLVKRKLLWMSASVSKLILLPLVVWAGTLLLGISGPAQAALVLASACPTAVASFAMAEAMGADGELAGEIVSSTTLFSIVSLTFWIVLLM